MSNRFGRTMQFAIASFVLVVALIGIVPQVSTAHTAITTNGSSVPVDPSSLLVEYDIPGSALNIVSSAPNSVWFTLPAEGQIGNLTLDAAGTATTAVFTPPTANSEPYDLVFDSANNAIWFTQKAEGRIGRLDIAADVTMSAITEFVIQPATTVPNVPTGIDIAPDGSIWFAESMSNRVMQYVPSSDTFNSSPAYVPTTPGVGSAEFHDIAISPNGSHLWVTAPTDHKVVQYTFTTNEFSTLALSGPFDPIPGNEREPLNIVATSPTVVWITDRAQSQIGQLSQGTLANVAWYTLPTAGSAPVGIAVDSINAGATVFFTGSATNLAGSLPASGNGALIPSEYELPSGSQPSGITVDSSGNVWIAQGGSNKIAVWMPPYFGFTYLPIIEKAQ